jgi:D-lactate dehydrogenase
MALIYFYDATELDRQQLTEELVDTDHHWEYVPEKISLENCNDSAEVISVFVSSTVTREMIEAMPKLKLIACRSTGFDNIDMSAAAKRNITVVNVPTYGEETVAEYAFMLLLALTRKLSAILETENQQFTPPQLRGHDLAGKTFAAIGAGHIGLNSLQIARGFSMNTLAYDAKPHPELEEQYGFHYADLDTILANADVISLHAPLLPATHHIINKATLAKMKPSAILINTARGELVDTGALLEALDNGRLGGAVLDVVEGETLLHYHEETALLRSDILPEDTLRHSVEISVLKKMPNVIISPHNAFNTVEAIGRINHTTAQNIIDFWYNKTPNEVRKMKPQIPPTQPGKLLIARHAESEWNATGRWTGITDVHLSEKGFKEARMLGEKLKELNIPLDIAYCSKQIRTHETLEGILNGSDQSSVPITAAGELNERDYGDYTGKNKWEIKELLGEEAFNKLRRGWNEPVPGGETLKDVYERAVPFYHQTILPELCHGKNVLVVAHGNTIRALIKYLKSLSDEDVTHVEMSFGEILIYDIAPSGLCTSDSIAKINTTPPKA